MEMENAVSGILTLVGINGPQNVCNITLAEKW